MKNEYELIGKEYIVRVMKSDNENYVVQYRKKGWLHKNRWFDYAKQLPTLDCAINYANDYHNRDLVYNIPVKIGGN